MIAALLSKRVRKWAVMTVAVPVAQWTLDQAATEVEKRRGEADGAARTLRKASGVLGKVRGRGKRQRP